MRNALIILFCKLALCCGLTTSGFCFEIMQPANGTIFHAGDKVLVRVQTNTGESIKSVLIFTDKIAASSVILQPPFEFEFAIDPAFAGELTITANGKLANNDFIESKVRINVALPVGVILKGMEVDPNPVFLYKLPANSDPNRISIFETFNISVGGIYSDGIARKLVSGNIYASSNEKVVKVDSKGKLTAQGIGSANVTVRNGEFKAVVQVIVKSKNR